MIRYTYVVDMSDDSLIKWGQTGAVMAGLQMGKGTVTVKRIEGGE